MENTNTTKFTGTYFQWIKHQLTGWDTFPWALWGFGIGFELALLLTNKITPLAIISFIGVFFGMWCTVAMSSGGTDANGNRVISHSINGLLGAISVIAYVYVNWTAGHWFSVLDQFAYFFLIDFGLMINWRTWGHGENGGKMNELSKKGWAIVTAIILIGWFAFYHLGVVLNDSNPIWDSLTFAIGATASWLCFKRYTSTYTLWICSNIVNLVLWFTALQAGYSQSALVMLVMNVFYMATAIYGKFVWKVEK